MVNYLSDNHQPDRPENNGLKQEKGYKKKEHKKSHNNVVALIN